MKTILVVDDDAAICKLTKVLLEKAGYRVLNASGGEEGLEIFQRHQSHIALLLTDVTMPRMSGLELADRVRRLHSQVRILFMSGIPQVAIRGFGFIAKPFQPSELIGRIGEVLSEAA